MIRVTVEYINGEENEKQTFEGKYCAMVVRGEDGNAIGIVGKISPEEMIKALAQLSSSALRSFFRTDDNEPVREMITKLFQATVEAEMEGASDENRTILREDHKRI